MDEKEIREAVEILNRDGMGTTEASFDAMRVLHKLAYDMLRHVAREMPEDLKNIGIDLVDEFFPKGECKERGQAIVLYAKLLTAFWEWHRKHLGG